MLERTTRGGFKTCMHFTTTFNINDQKLLYAECFYSYWFIPERYSINAVTSTLCTTRGQAFMVELTRSKSHNIPSQRATTQWSHRPHDTSAPPQTIGKKTKIGSYVHFRSRQMAKLFRKSSDTCLKLTETKLRTNRKKSTSHFTQHIPTPYSSTPFTRLWVSWIACSSPPMSVPKAHVRYSTIEMPHQLYVSLLLMVANLDEPPSTASDIERAVLFCRTAVRTSPEAQDEV